MSLSEGWMNRVSFLAGIFLIAIIPILAQRLNQSLIHCKNDYTFVPHALTLCFLSGSMACH
jgi:hypothetical protein